MARSGLKAKAVPREWVEALASVLDGDPASADAGRARPSRPRAPCRSRRRRQGRRTCAARLLRIAADATNPAELRLEALAAVPGGLVRPDPKLFDVPDRAARSASGPWRPGRPRPTSWRGPSSTPDQLDRLADALATAGPLEVDRLLAAFEQSTDEALGLKLVDGPRRVAGPVEPEGRRAQGPPGEVRPGGPEAGRGALRQAQRRRGQAEGPARGAPGHARRRATSAAARSSSTARRPRASPVTPSATAAATSAPT